MNGDNSPVLTQIEIHGYLMRWYCRCLVPCPVLCMDTKFGAQAEKSL
jgi:hypothetical protein